MMRKTLFPAALLALNVVTVAARATTGGSSTMTQPIKQRLNQPSSACTAPGAVLTVEEQRTTLSLPGRTTPVARDFIEAAGFQNIVDGFADRLCGFTSVAEASAAIKAAGASL